MSSTLGLGLALSAYNSDSDSSAPDESETKPVGILKKGRGTGFIS